MKNPNILVSLPLFALFASAAYASVPPVTAAIPVTHIYAPQGFDSNDPSEVIITGYLPDLCYRAPSTYSQVSGQTIQIQAEALRPSQNALCPLVAMPLLEAVQVGVLEKGEYGIVVNQPGSNPVTSSIYIEEARGKGVENSVYANTGSVDRIPGTRAVILTGINPVNCYELDQIRYISNGKDTYTVLPIMKQSNATCESRPTAFSYQWDVPTELSAIEPMPLLHVRVMNGKSINKLFDESK
jgi:hypothetical protein